MVPDKAEKPKRKKISWACNHCNKAHITCDEARPCQRCIQKGLQDSCADAPRKRKKYLDDLAVAALPVYSPESRNPRQEPVLDTMIYDYEARNPQLLQATVFQHSASLPNYFNQSNLQMGQNASESTYYREPIDSFYREKNGNFPNGLELQGMYQKPDRKKPNFASLAADLEYSTLSNILSVHHTTASSNEEAPNSNVHSPALSPHGGHGPIMNASLPSLVANSYAAQVFTRPEIIGDKATDSKLPFDERINQYILGKTPYYRSILFPDVTEALRREGSKPNSELALSFTIAIQPENPDPNSLFAANNPLFKEPEEIYARISKPFSYTPGYHKLIAYLRKRFPKDMLVRLAKSMAVYRPSFIACTNSLRESDLIFMEQCFQRTLLTYNDFIKISGTPTIVWRRTGEIAYVGEEFCVLTGWTKQQLIGPRPMFIVELLDDKSVVEYFELFSKIAFGDFLGATMTECTLLTPKNVKIRAGCIWTLKRDVFGIPMMIIGNFLPIV